MRGIASLDLFIRPGASARQREDALLGWHREQLKALIPPLLAKWQPVIGVQASGWGVCPQSKNPLPIAGLASLAFDSVFGPIASTGG